MLYRGFQSTNRANPLAQKIVASDIALGLNDNFAFYTADNCRSGSHAYRCRCSLQNLIVAFLNNTQMPASFNYMAPSETRTINGQRFTESQRFGVSASSQAH